MKYFLILFFLASPMAKSEENKTTQFGKHHAVTAFNKEEGFKLSAKAMSSLDIKFETLKEGSSWKIPKESLVQIKQSFGVYRRLDGWISFVLIKVNGRQENTATITSPDLQAGDEVAITGAPFLRMTDADLNSDTVDNCAH